jgi:hypothetical protein
MAAPSSEFVRHVGSCPHRVIQPIADLPCGVEKLINVIQTVERRKIMAKCDVMVMESILPFSSNKNDGLFLVREVDDQGNIKGYYRPPQGDEEQIKNGKCKENVKQFHCERTGFSYDGEVFGFNGDGIIVVVGKRSRKQRDRGEEDDDEVWVGVKTGT